MRVLLDECLPRRLKRLLVGHECFTVPEMGWAGRSNGELLRLAQAHFDVFLTSDRNLTFQQSATGLGTAVIVLVAPSNRLESLRPLIPAILEQLARIGRGAIVYVE